MIYLDNAATTRVTPEVMSIVEKYMTEGFGNPSSLHKVGLDAETAVDKSAKIIAKILNCKPKDIIFTSGGTESNNTAIFGDFFNHPNKIKHYITSNAEHHSVLSSFEHLEKIGQRVTYLPITSDGVIDEASLMRAIENDTALISLMYVNNETGAINDIARCVRQLKDFGYNGYVHTDATQAIGKIKVDIEALGVDFLTASGHKFNAPKGVGLLYVGDRVVFKPFIFGGGQQLGRRSGTLNVAAIAGMATALKLKDNSLDTHYDAAKNLEKFLIDQLRLSAFKPMILAEHNKSPFITAVAFPRIKSEVLLHSLESRGIYVSSRSACGSHRRAGISHVIVAMDIAEEYRDGVIRISFGENTTKDEVTALITALNDIIPQLTHVIGESFER